MLSPTKILGKYIKRGREEGITQKEEEVLWGKDDGGPSWEEKRGEYRNRKIHVNTNGVA